MQQTRQQPLFSLGQVVATPGALAALEKAGQGPLDFLSRHVHGDWGDLCEEDRQENQFSLERGIPALEQLSNPCRRETLRHHRSRPLRHHDSFAGRVLNISRIQKKGEKR